MPKGKVSVDTVFNIKGVLWHFSLVEWSGYSRLFHLKQAGRAKAEQKSERGPWFCEPLWSNPSVSVLVQNRHNTAVLWIITHFRIRNTVTSLLIVYTYLHTHTHTNTLAFLRLIISFHYNKQNMFVILDQYLKGQFTQKKLILSSFPDPRIIPNL